MILHILIKKIFPCYAVDLGNEKETGRHGGGMRKFKEHKRKERGKESMGQNKR